MSRSCDRLFEAPLSDLVAMPGKCDDKNRAHSFLRQVVTLEFIIQKE